MTRFVFMPLIKLRAGGGRLGTVWGLSEDAAGPRSTTSSPSHAERDVAEDKGSPIADLREFAWMRRLLWIGIGLAVAQQFTGVNTIVYYGTTILEATGQRFPVAQGFLGWDGVAAATW